MKSKSELNMQIEQLEGFIALAGKTMKEMENEHTEMRLKIQEATTILDDIPRPNRWLEEDCEDSSRDISCDNFAEINEKMNRLREVFR